MLIALSFLICMLTVHVKAAVNTVTFMSPVGGSPVMLSGLVAGEHHFMVSPVGCGRNSLSLTFKFTV